MQTLRYCWSGLELRNNDIDSKGQLIDENYPGVKAMKKISVLLCVARLLRAVPTSVVAYLTQKLNRVRLGKIGKGGIIVPGVALIFPEHIYIGDDVSISGRAYLQASSKGYITIGDRCAIAAYSKIITPTHDPMALPVSSVGINKSVTIGDDVWIGTAALILPGVTVGSGAIVAAGAVVTKDVPENTMVAGVPARIIKNLPSRVERFRNGQEFQLNKDFR